MTVWLATTTVDVYRDADTTDVDVFGDATETGETVPILQGVPASIIETTETRSLPSQLATDEVRTFTVRVAQRWGIAEADRLRDVRAGAWYEVQKVTTPPAFVGVPSSRLTCIRVGSVV